MRQSIFCVRMDVLRNLPDSTSVAIKVVATVLGLSASVVALLTAATTLMSYVGAARRAARAAFGVAGITARMVRLLWHSPIGFVLASALTVLTIAGQTLAVGLCYLGAAVAEIPFNPRRTDAFVATVNRYEVRTLLPEHAKAFLQPDWFTIGYAVVAILVLLWCYRGATHGIDHADGGALLMAAPVVLMLGQALLVLAFLAFFTVLVLFVQLLTGRGLSDWYHRVGGGAALLVVESIVCSVYWLACRTAARACAAVTDAWSPAGSRARRGTH